MKYVISGTDRKGSRTLQVAKFIQGLYRIAGEEVELVDLSQLPTAELTHGVYGGELPGKWKEITSKMLSAEGLHFVVPEYNGSMPGSLKFFIDQWKYPDAFEHRPICFVGLGGIFGGLRPVEHLQQVFAYRNAFIFPERVFILAISKSLEDGQIKDPVVVDLMKKQVSGFQKFVRALQSEKLHACDIVRSPAARL